MPNIVFITTHDTGRHFGCYGVETVQSPNIDALAARGVLCTRAFAAGAVCSPSRAAMMTGRYPQSNGVMGLIHTPYYWEYRDGERHLAGILRDHGYSTHLFMFQHESLDSAKIGFDHLHCMPPPQDLTVLPPAEIHPCAAEVAESFSKFCESQKDAAAPFYAQIGFFETHRPFGYNGNEGDDAKGVTVPPMYDARFEGDFRLLQALVRDVDDAVGVMVEALRSNGLLEDTIIVFTVDHGLPFPRSKGTTYESGLGVALVIHWSGGGLQEGLRLDQLVSNIDIVPTLLDFLGQPRTPELQGLSFSAACGGPGGDAPRETVFGMMHGDIQMRSVRSERYKLIRSFTPDRLKEFPLGSKTPRRELPFCQLFDLAADPDERTDLSGDPAYAKVREELDSLLLAHLREFQDPILEGAVPTPYQVSATADFLGAAPTAGVL